MALLSCPECSREVSDQAAACPHCGYPLTARLATTTAAQPDGPDRRIRQVLVSQGKIAAIKLCRDLTPGLSLADAKQHVDRLETELPAASRHRVGGSGCLLVFAALAVAVWLLMLCLTRTTQKRSAEAANVPTQPLFAQIILNGVPTFPRKPPQTRNVWPNARQPVTV